MELALLGGSLRAGSVSAQILSACAGLAAPYGVRTTVLTASDLALPLYVPGSSDRPAAALRLLSALRRADGLIIATPAYHGGVSGLLKNALDYVEDLAGDTPAYLTDRAVGAVGVGWSQHGAAGAVADLRNTIMCLRGWVTPMAVTVNSAGMAAEDGALLQDPQTMRRLEIMVGQVVDFTRPTASARLALSTER